MPKSILLIQGHPDTSQKHYGHALAEAYRQGAINSGHQVDEIDVATLDFSLLRSYEDFYESGEPPPVIKDCQQKIKDASHIVIFYPLWLGGMPALLKGFFEQAFRPGFAMQPEKEGRVWRKLLKGKSARVVVTMGMPAFVYRWFYHAHSLKSLERNILNFCGIKPVRRSLIGMVEGSDKHRKNWLLKMAEFGKSGK